MQQTAPAPSRNARLTRPRKRRRIIPNSSSPIPQNTYPHPSSAGIKRSRSTSLKPTISLKRRSVSPHVSPPPSAKRQRVCDKPDIDMTDIRRPTSSTPSRRPASLHNVLRKERASSTMLREMHVRRAEAVRQQMTRCARPIVEDSMSETLVSASSRGATFNLEKEEVLEEVDASESTEIPREGVTPGVQAALLQDGRCAVHIVREDGTTQIVVIEPPGTGGDEYAWYE